MPRSLGDRDDVLLVEPEGPPLGSADDALDLIGRTFGSPRETVVVPVERLDPDFLDLSTRMLGEFTQKFVQYGRRLVILGELGDRAREGTPLSDYVRETNRGGAVWLIPDERELERRLG